MLKLFCWAVFIVFLCAVTPAMAEPPQTLVSHVSALPLAHKGECNFQMMKAVKCLIFYDEKNDVTWLVLFSKKLKTTHVIAVKDKKETIVWLNPDLQV